MATSIYGSFYNFEGTALTPQDVVSSVLSGAGAEYGERAVKIGAFDAMVDDYVAAIQDLLPEGVFLCGSEITGPAEDRFDEKIRVQIREAIAAADLTPIIARHDFALEEDADLDAIIAKHENALEATYAVTAYVKEYGETHEVSLTVEATSVEDAVAQAKADLAERGRPNIQDAIARLIDAS
jgi:hypothetical protein